MSRARLLITLQKNYEFFRPLQQESLANHIITVLDQYPNSEIPDIDNLDLITYQWRKNFDCIKEAVDVKNQLVGLTNASERIEFILQQARPFPCHNPPNTAYILQ